MAPVANSPGAFGLSPYLKFIAPALLTIFSALVAGLVAGDWDLANMEILVVGLLSATVSFVVTNGTTGISRYAKALAPAGLTVVGVGLHYLFSGEWNDTELIAAITGLGAALVTFLAPNAPVTPGPEPVVDRVVVA